MTRHRLEVADVFRVHGPEFLEALGSSHSLAQKRVLRDISVCRTEVLGGHVEKCDRCGHRRISYNSCRNRHCPKCQGAARAAWMEARAAELLPVPYFHVVFTLPSTFRPLALQNKRVVYGILFRAASETLQEVAANPERLGARIGFLAVLHTWGQKLTHHPHLHCVVAGGGISPDGSRWIPCKRSKKQQKAFLLPERVLRHVFQGKFIDYLKQAYRKGTLEFHGDLQELKHPASFERMLNVAVARKWVVYAKRPFSGPKAALKYLARYTHRVAISNSRLVSMEAGQVTFRWKDYANGCQVKTTTLAATEFIRRFLLHTLPKNFMRIRHFGFLSNRFRQEKLNLCRRLLHVQPESQANDQNESNIPDAECEVRCPVCEDGRMQFVETIEPGFPQRAAGLNRVFAIPAWDTS